MDSSIVPALEELQAAALSLEAEHAEPVRAQPPDHQASARNLLHYLAVRQHDLRDLQTRLAELGLSSLGRMEPAVITTLAAVLKRLGQDRAASAPLDLREGAALLQQRARQLLGPAPPGQRVRVMVTLPQAAERDPALISELLRAGTTILRINCAHGDKAEWRVTVEEARAAARQLQTECRILMDLAGPKIRTGPLPGSEDSPATSLRLNAGDTLCLTRAQKPGGAASLPPGGEVLRPAHISCTLPALLDSLHPGHRVLFDDGKLEGVVRANEREGVLLEITRGGKLKAAKGINVPDSEVPIQGLTDEDLDNLDFVIQHADLVGLSFVREARDVDELRRRLDKQAERRPGVLLKVETRSAFQNLPWILLAGLKLPSVGVMVARGDLGPEIGFERLAEVQEELLWLCEAAHVPVVWATQVLEKMAKKGTPTRAEVTDAAMSSRAECVMLNKGPYIVEAVRFLLDVLRRMEEHQAKKRSMLRPLQVSFL